MTVQFKVIAFVVLSAAFAWLTRSSLLRFRSHGFYRFFAWVTILALILINIDYWFYEPFRIHQVVSWSLLIASLFVGIYGVRLLHLIGKPDSKREDPSLIGIEKTTELVTVGIYRYIRHPLYSSLLFLAWGAFFKHLSWEGVILAAIATLFLTITARIEETENVIFFGAAYRSYMKQTRMFVPFLF
jgi:protein-S-isoprenylcysteine O-methyltransferase Ste14